MTNSEKNSTPRLTSTQIGAIAESVVANALMRDSHGRLSPFWSIADDDGIDLLVYDKDSGRAIPVQVKSRTNTLKKRGSQERGNVVHFEIRSKALREFQNAHVITVLLTPDLSSIKCAWFMPMKAVVKSARHGKEKFVIRANYLESSKDKFSPYRCGPGKDLAQRVITALGAESGRIQKTKPAKKRDLFTEMREGFTILADKRRGKRTLR